MIFIDRNAVPRPIVLDERGRAEDDKARDYFQSEEARAGHAKFPFRVYRDKSVREALDRLFQHKCAFCESRIGHASFTEIEHFRPKQRAIDLDGSHFPVHYFWLANEWRNLYPACEVCNHSKRNRFPIAGERAAIDDAEQDPEALFEIEKPLLLDPCREDDRPEQKLVYTEDGLVTSDDERGRITIEILGLNRTPLVEARRRTLDHLLAQIHAVEALTTAMDRGERALDESLLTEEIERIMVTTQDGAPFAGMCRQFTRRFMAGLDEAAERADEAAPPEAKRTWMPEESDQLRKARVVSHAEQEKVADEFKAFEAEAQAYSVDQGPARVFFTQSRTIRRIELHNVRPIADLILDLEASDPDDTPCTMLLGENGCGKSTVLKAVALALMGDDYRREPRLELDAGSFVRFGCDEGWVKVHLTGMSKPITMTFTRGEPRFEGGEVPKVLLLAYGATRLLPRGPTERRGMGKSMVTGTASASEASQRHGTRYARVDNLFDPFVPMADARSWLLGLPAATFDVLKPALKQLLTLGEDDDLEKNPAEDRVDVTLFGDVVSLEHLSDGYQTVLAVAAEIMSVLLEYWPDIAAAEGIVLLDEVGSHLHPSWQMRIVGALRATFPSVQFLLTTHNPLCLRGMKNGEVIVMQRDPEGRVVIETDLPNPEAMRIDQILLSDYFGLSSTVDHEVNALYDRYYELLMIAQRDEAEQRELERIRDLMAEQRQLGESPRERMMLEAIDEYRIERLRLASTDQRAELKAETKRDLRELWSRIRGGAKPGVGGAGGGADG